MTCEVCMMNRLAVVLAADSASTITHWTEEGKEEQRYFKGANKVFQLSNHHPIGLMIFASAELLGVPWEVVVKEFRRELGAQRYNTVAEYATAFFSFLDANARLFPRAAQADALLDGARRAIYRHVHAQPKEGTPEERNAAFDRSISQRRAIIDGLPWAPRIDAPFADGLIAEFGPSLGTEIEGLRPQLEGFPETSDYVALASLGILEVLKAPENFFGRTGLVFAGFGHNDIFPAMVEHSSCGLIMDRHIARDGTSVVIDHQQPAWLSGFAQTAMIDTFQLGLSEDVYGILLEALTANLKPLAEKMMAKLGVDASRIVEVAANIAESRAAIIQHMIDRSKQNHAFPLRRVLGVLPVDEMAELAETLINLQSLKEKVTKPSETVGGPVDVAVITKSEGMVWIKRKLYFDQNLNARYMQRQAMMLETTTGIGR